MLLRLRKYLIPPILAVSFLMGLVDIAKSGIKYKIYSGLLLLFHVINNLTRLIIVFPKTDEMFSEVNLSQRIWNIMNTVYLSEIVVNLVFLHSRNFQQLVTSMKHFDRYFGNSPQEGYIILSLTIKDYFFITIYFFLEVKETKTFTLFTLIFLMYPQVLVINTAYYLKLFLVIQFAKRFHLLNKLLEQHLQAINMNEFDNRPYNSQTDLAIIIQNPNRKQIIKKEIKDISKFHNKVCDYLDTFNKIFGINMMFEVIFGILLITAETIKVIVQTGNIMGTFSIYRELNYCLCVANLVVSILYYGSLFILNFF